MKLKNVLVGSIAAAVLLAVGIFVVIGTGILNPLQHQMKLGYKLLEEGSYEEALLAFDKALSIDAKNVNAHIYKARAEIELGKHDSALETVATAVKLVAETERTYADEDFARIVEWWIENSDPADDSFEELLKLLSLCAPDIVRSYAWGNPEYENEVPYREYERLYLNEMPTEKVRYTGKTKPNAEAIRKKLVGTWSYQGDDVYALLIDKLYFYPDGRVKNTAMRLSYDGTYEVGAEGTINMTFHDNSGYAPPSDESDGHFEVEAFDVTLKYNIDADTITVPSDAYSEFGYEPGAIYKK